MEMTQNITILSVGKPYSIANDATKEYNSGCTMWYCNTSDITGKIMDNNSGVLGHAPVKQTMPVEFYEEAKIVGIPAQAIGKFAMRNKGTGMVLVLEGYEWVKASSSEPAKEKGK